MDKTLGILFIGMAIVLLIRPVIGGMARLDPNYQKMQWQLQEYQRMEAEYDAYRDGVRDSN